MITTIEVKTKKEQKEFLDFPLNLYKGNKYFVPPLYMDEKKIFSKNYHYYENSEAKYFLAINEKGDVLGRISAIYLPVSNKKWNQQRIRFTRFDSIDNQEVATALFKAVENYAKEKGMKEIVGPLGFSDLEKEGLLIEGFDYLSTYEEQYNYPYYQKLIENCGFSKDVDWLESRLYPLNGKIDRLLNISSRMIKKYNLHVVPKMSPAKYVKHYGHQFLDLIDETYNEIYGTVPLTEKTKKELMNGFKMILNMDYIGTIVDENDKIVSCAVAFPAIGEVLQKNSGHLDPITLIKLLKYIKHPTKIDFGLICVIKKYEGLGVSSYLLGEISRNCQKNKIEYGETNLNLETNVHILNQWKNFDSIQHKRRRCFIKKI